MDALEIINKRIDQLEWLLKREQEACVNSPGSIAPALECNSLRDTISELQDIWHQVSKKEGSSE